MMKAEPAKKRTRTAVPAAKRILCIDVGGTGLKAAIIAPRGKYRARAAAGQDAQAPHAAQDRAGAGRSWWRRLGNSITSPSVFPARCKDGKVISAPHFGTEDWTGFDLAAAMQKKLKKPVKLLNDADVQGLAAIKGKGLELVCTLGTGFGTAWFRDGELMPHMDLAHLVDAPQG